VLFADDVSYGSMAALTAALTLVLPAAGVAGKWLYDRWRERHKDVIGEWQDIANRAQEVADRRLAELSTVTARHEVELSALRENFHKCELTRMDQAGDLKVLQATVRWLQGLPGEGPPAIISPTVIVMDLAGKVRTANPSITPLLHWLPVDLLGKNIEMIVPEQFRKDRRNTLEQIKALGDAPWPGKMVQTTLLSKEGTEVPVAIAISSWADESAGGSRLVCWEMARRAVAPGDNP
jgi:PAS domain S-box-containing protein